MSINDVFYFSLLLIPCLYIQPTTATNATCDWEFLPKVVNPTQGELLIKLHNPTRKSQEYMQLLICPTLDVVYHPPEKMTVPPMQTGTSTYLLGVSVETAAANPNVFEHRCTHSTWLKNETESTRKCEMVVRTYLGGTFLMPCSDYSTQNMTVTWEGKEEEKVIVLQHFGKTTQYMANTSCVPNLHLLVNGNMYNSLKDGDKWTIPLLPNCSNVLDIDYEGRCKISIYHMCQERAFVAEVLYRYTEGEVPACEGKWRPEFETLSLSAYIFDDPMIEDPLWFSLFFVALLIVAILIKILILVIKYGLEEGMKKFREALGKAFCCCCKRKDSTTNEEDDSL